MLDRHLHRLARRPRLGVLFLGTCLWGGTALAGPADQLSDEPPARRANPRPIPSELVDELTNVMPEPSAAGVAKSHTFYLNYDGVTIKYTGGEDNSAQNVSQFPDFAMTYQPYGDGPKRAASLQALQSDWLKYDVSITDVRPNSGPYTMCVNSPTNPFGGGVLGIAPLDCADGQAANIVFAYHQANDQFSAATQATTMSQEIAHAYGLEHVKEPNDIMNPYNAGGDPSFIDQCFSLDDGGQGILCSQQHNQFCQGQQNSHQELVWLFGLREPDMIPPTCKITFPTDGQTFMQAPMDLTIQAEASDNDSVSQVSLLVDGSPQEVDAAAPYTWDGSFPEGTYCISCKAVDPSKNTGESPEVCFSVVKEGDPGTTSTTTTSGGPTTDPQTTDPSPTTGPAPTTSGADTGVDPSAGETGGPDSGPALPPGYGENGDAEGCGCDERRSGEGGLLLLVALAALRRRRK